MTLKDEDIQYIVDEAPEPPMPGPEAFDHFYKLIHAQVEEPNLAMNEAYIEPKPQVLKADGLSKEDLNANIQYCKDTNHDGEFTTSEGARWTYNATSGEVTMHGYAKIDPACKYFSPSQAAIDALGAQVAREYKYDRAYSELPCCQNRTIDSPCCLASNNQADCRGYEPEEWQPVKLATGENGQELVWERGRMFSGIPYNRVTENGNIVSAITGSKTEDLEIVWKTTCETTNATENPLPEPGPKNPYLQSLLV